MPKKGYKRLGIDIPPDQHRGLKLAATEAGVSMSEVVRWLISEGLERRELTGELVPAQFEDLRVEEESN